MSINIGYGAGTEPLTDSCLDIVQHLFLFCTSETFSKVGLTCKPIGCGVGTDKNGLRGTGEYLV